MNELAPMGPLTVSPDQLQSILKLYDTGLYLQAYQLAQTIGPLPQWRGAEARILAGRLAGNLGAPRLGDWHFLHAWRQHRANPEAMWFYVRTLLAFRGPLAAWRFVKAHPFPKDAPKKLLSHWYSQKGAILGLLRDFDAAEEWLKKADDLGAEPWTCLEWAALYSLEDRHEQAESAARQALELHPWYRPAVQWVAHFHVQKERDAEAIDLLTQATQNLESGAVFAQLAALQIELKRYEDALKNLDAFERFSPLLEDNQRQWLDARRCDIACYQGDYDRAIDFAKRLLGDHETATPQTSVQRRNRELNRKAAGKFYEGLIKRLENRPENPKRVEIPVGYVRQHHKTCGPATLTSIAKFWQMPADHVDVADEIAYLGTPHHNERKWAEEHGWYPKSFTVTWDAAVALLERGIPFTLTTTEVSSAHLQAVIGYDNVRGTLIIRDPGERHRVELAFDLVRDRYRSTGPRGMALVPTEHAEKLKSLALPDEALYEHVQRFDLALEANRRAEAGEAAKTLEKLAPGHFLTLYVKRALVHYDADPQAELIVTEQLLKLFPGDLFLELARVDILRFVGSREQRLETLKRLAEKKETDPACWNFYAAEMMMDARRDAQTLYWLRRTIRATPPNSPLQARSFELLARIRMEQRKFDEALELHYFAVCLEDRDEFVAQNYFYAARARGEAERALQLLQKRFDRFGAKSSQPARTLYNALMQMDRYGDAFDVLDKAMKLRPKDGELLTYAADAHTYRAEFDEAEQILARADGVSKPGMRLRSLAYLAMQRGDRRQARDLYQEIIKTEPLAIDAHRWYLQLVAEMDENSAAVEHIAAMCERFPHHFGLAQLHFEWLAHRGLAAREPVLKKMIENHPANAWARIEYAYDLNELGRLEEAHAQLDQAEPLDPDGPSVWHGRGMVYKKQQRIEDAQYAFREAIRKNVDFDLSIRELIFSCENLQERRDAVAFIVSELLRQPTSGDGITMLTNAIGESLPIQEVQSIQRRILEARPDLWQAWMVNGWRLENMGKDEEFLAHAQQSIQRFPSRSELWLNLAQAKRFNGDLQGELKSLERAVEIAPNYQDAVRMLAEAHERAGAMEEARRVYEKAIQRTPLAPQMYDELAAFCWRRNERDAAITHARKSLAVDPWYERAWSDLCAWSTALGRLEDVIALAREWTKKRPGNSHMWVRLAWATQLNKQPTSKAEDKDRLDAAAKAYDQALKRTPFVSDYYDAKAEMLALGRSYEDALKVCSPAAYKGKPTHQMRLRGAWIKAMDGDYDTAKQQVCAVLREDPRLEMAWKHLFDWSYATHEFREVIEVATEIARKRPQSARALYDRGSARIRLDDERTAGIDDLRGAFRRDPCHWGAGFQLFDELMNDDDLTGAEGVLLILQQNSGPGRGAEFVKVRQLQYHAKKGNQAIALETFKNLCEMTFRYPAPDVLYTSIRALDAAGWKKDAEQIVTEAMKRPNYNPELATMFATQWNPNKANDLPDRIAALDAALGRFPDTFRYLDLKAELLANGNQFERAWQVCQEKTFAQDQPWLDGRTAWVLYRSGRVQEAFVKMKDLVKEYPDYHWGWWQLADWYARQMNWVEVLTVAEQLVVINPRDPSGYAFRGQAKFNLNDPQAARTDYIHAIDLDPKYMFAAWNLFDIYVRNSEWQRAEKILEKAKKHADKGEWALRKVDLLVYQNRKTNFATEFENLCRNSEKAPWLLDQSLQLLVQAGWWSDAEQVLHRCLDLGPHICDPWIRLRVQFGDRRVASDIENMSERRPERTNCVAAYAIELAYGKDSRGLRTWANAHDDELRAETPCWAKVGFAFSVVQDWQGTIEWMSDWEDHEKATPGQLLPLVKALRSLGYVDDARKVSQHAIVRLNPDYANAFHKVWLMYDQALEGDVTAVQRYLETSDLGGFDGYHQMIAAMVRALWMSTTDKQNGFARARQTLADAATWAPPTIHDPALTKTYQQCIGHLAQLQGTFTAKLWRMWRWLSPLLPRVQKMG